MSQDSTKQEIRSFRASMRHDLLLQAIEKEDAVDYITLDLEIAYINAQIVRETKELTAKLGALYEQREALSNNAEIRRLTKDYACAVQEWGHKPASHPRIKVHYLCAHVRKSWDREALYAFAEKHPEILTCEKTTKVDAVVQIQILGLELKE